MTILVLLHYLGGSACTWRPLIEHLPGVRTVAIDLPGFGDGQRGGYDVEAMADAASTVIAAARLPAYALVGHSMGAKIATVLARRAEDGAPGLENLTHLVLVARSPPSPEPMDEDKRREMLGWFAGDPATSREQASAFVAANVTGKLAANLHESAVDDVLRADPAAWRAWLERGSREDWSARIGRLDTPALIVTGADDPFLGRDGQSRHTAPHLSRHRHITLDATKHLIPLERPAPLAALIGTHVQ